MSDRVRQTVFALLVCCTVTHADPFAPAPVPEQEETSSPPPARRVAGVAVLGERAVAVMQVPHGRFRVVRIGDRVGDAVVTGITLDAVELETDSGVLRLPIGE